ncbi:hypothetical protein U0070_024389, partial [Myodes glareolus]
LSQKNGQENCFSLDEFIFKGVINNHDLKVTLFTTFLFFCIINFLANLGMIILVRMDSQLHLPIYFFLSYLSFCDLWYSTATRLRCLWIFPARKKLISVVGCVFQLFTLCNFPRNCAFHVFQTKFCLFPRSRQMSSLFYILVIPMLNPLIYSLREKDMKNALEKFIVFLRKV